MSIKRFAEVCAEEWRTWQSEVVRLVRRELAELAPCVHGDDFDWDSWRSYFDEGYLPFDAVKQALSLNSSRGRSYVGDAVTYPAHYMVR